jgi:hypothetical protein
MVVVLIRQELIRRWFRVHESDVVVVLNAEEGVHAVANHCLFTAMLSRLPKCALLCPSTYQFGSPFSIAIPSWRGLETTRFYASRTPMSVVARLKTSLDVKHLSEQCIEFCIDGSRLASIGDIRRLLVTLDGREGSMGHKTH